MNAPTRTAELPWVPLLLMIAVALLIVGGLVVPLLLDYLNSQLIPPVGADLEPVQPAAQGSRALYSCVC